MLPFSPVFLPPFAFSLFVALKSYVSLKVIGGNTSLSCLAIVHKLQILSIPCILASFLCVSTDNATFFHFSFLYRENSLHTVLLFQLHTGRLFFNLRNYSIPIKLEAEDCAETEHILFAFKNVGRTSSVVSPVILKLESNCWCILILEANGEIPCPTNL